MRDGRGRWACMPWRREIGRFVAIVGRFVATINRFVAVLSGFVTICGFVTILGQFRRYMTTSSREHPRRERERKTPDTHVLSFPVGRSYFFRSIRCSNIGSIRCKYIGVFVATNRPSIIYVNSSKYGVD